MLSEGPADKLGRKYSRLEARLLPLFSALKTELEATGAGPSGKPQALPPPQGTVRTRLRPRLTGQGGRDHALRTRVQPHWLEAPLAVESTPLALGVHQAQVENISKNWKNPRKFQKAQRAFTAQGALLNVREGSDVRAGSTHALCGQDSGILGCPGPLQAQALRTRGTTVWLCPLGSGLRLRENTESQKPGPVSAARALGSRTRTPAPTSKA